MVRGIGRPNLDHSFKQADMAVIFPLVDGETSAQSAQPSLIGCNDERPPGSRSGIRRRGHKYFSPDEGDQPYCIVKMHIDDTGSIEHDLRTIRQYDGTAFTGSGAMIGMPFTPDGIVTQQPSTGARKSYHTQ